MGNYMGYMLSALQAVKCFAGPVVFSFVQAVRQNQALTYNVLLRAIRYALKNGPQHFVHSPQMFSSRRLDFNEEVRL